MSASSKKKLRNALNAEKLTEKQLAQQKEARKLKLYTAAFVTVLALVVLAAAWIGISTTVSNSGLLQRNTVALTVGDHELNNVEMNFFFIEAVNQFYSKYGSYASLFGLDLTQPLDEQVRDDAGNTWADYFMDQATSSAQAAYALLDAADAAGYALTQEEIDEVDQELNSLTVYYTNPDDYIRSVYGSGATLKLLRQHCLDLALAESYQNYYLDSLTYDEAAIAAESESNNATYNSYNYNYYYVTTSSYLTGGTTDEEGTVTYSDEEQAAAVEAAKADAESLVAGEYSSVKDFDLAIGALEINADSDSAASTAKDDTAYSSVPEAIRDWICDSARKEGDIASLPSTSTDAEGNETVNGYYVTYFRSIEDNEFPLVNVRHILVPFEGGTTDDYGTTTYSDEEKQAALTQAEEILQSWKDGEATEDSFAALANEKSTDTGSNTNGGLYENVYPGQMVTNFNDWCFDSSRAAGDTGIVESSYGYHVMFYSSASSTTYRDYMIINALQEADYSAWYTALVEAVTVKEGNTSYVSTDLVLSY